ncbi:MAG: hypothetical protein LBP22_00070 [Deltaproteobacteria bacterium]|jgi:hypothetical protein|nr:hypothetical protein [Deltaproteobacteria bacterium]
MMSASVRQSAHQFGKVDFDERLLRAGNISGPDFKVTAGQEAVCLDSKEYFGSEPETWFWLPDRNAGRPEFTPNR